VYDGTARQMMEILGQQAGFENQQDQAVMQGEDARRIADRHDKDQYYTNKGKGLEGIGRSVQQLGKNVGQIDQNQMLMEFLKMLDTNGLLVKK
jgi:hypothetical protein